MNNRVVCQGCDPLASGQVAGKDEMVMFFMIELFQNYTGLPGLFLATIFSGYPFRLFGCVW